jgi:hypothetical protein
VGTARAAPDWGALEARGARIEEVRVEVREVFDRSDPREDTWVGRLANRVHIETRERVIRQALLFKPGEPVSARHVRETERRLRSMIFLKEAEITPELLEDGRVRAHVRVRDAWTLKFTIHYQLLGGQSTSGFALQEQNLLGTGKTLVFNWLKDPERTTETLAYRDSQLLGSDWTLAAGYSRLSDGSARTATLQRPFLSLDTPWSATFQASNQELTYSLSDRGDARYSARSRLDKGLARAAVGLPCRGDTVWRPGLVFLDQQARYGDLSVPANPGALPAPNLSRRVLRGPGLSLNFLVDRYGTWRDLFAMDATEDYNLGWSWGADLGRLLPAWGASEPATWFQASMGKGWSSSPDDLLLLRGTASGRRGPRGWEDALAGLVLTGYWKQTPHWVTAAWLDLDRACRPDPEDVLYLGAIEGLRGYRNFLHPGDTRWLFSLEQRLLTDYRWLGIFRLGFVAFADVGAIHRLDGRGWTSPYPDLGGGLRLGDLKSSLGQVVLITASHPLTRTDGQGGWQLAIGNIVQF